MSSRKYTVGIIVALVVLVAAAVVAGVLLFKSDDTSVPAEADTRIPAEVALDDPNREAYYLRDVRSWMDRNDIHMNEENLDENLLDLGYALCELQGLGMSAEDAALALEDMGSPLMFTLGMVGASGAWLCPEHIDN